MARLLQGGAVRALGPNGEAVPGAKLYLFEADSSTPVQTYSDVLLETFHPTPIVADSTGTFPEIYVPAGSYKVDIHSDINESIQGYPSDYVHVEGAVAGAGSSDSGGLQLIPTVVCSGDVLRIILIASGQSNAVGKGVGGNDTISNLVKVWDTTVEGFVQAENGVEPFEVGKNSSTLQMANELALLYGLEVMIVLNVQGGLPIRFWTNPANGLAIPTEPVGGVDMWSPLLEDVQDALNALGASDVSAMLWTQGESDNSNPLDDYYDQSLEFKNSLAAQTWWTDKTRFLDVLLYKRWGAQSFTKQWLSRGQSATHMVIPTEGLGINDETNDLHFDGPALDEIGKRAAYAFACPQIQRLNAFCLDDNATIEVKAPGTSGAIFDDLNDVFEFLQPHAIDNKKRLTISVFGEHEITPQLVETPLMAFEHPFGSNIILTGQNVTDMPELSDFVDVKATDIAMMEGKFPTHLICESQGLAILGNLGLFKNFLIKGNPGIDGLVVGDRSGARNGGNVKIENIGIVDFPGAGIEIRPGGFIEAAGALGDPSLVIAYCKNGIDNYSGRAVVPGTVITLCERNGVYTAGGEVNVASGDITGNNTDAHGDSFDLYVANGQAGSVISANDQLATTTLNRPAYGNAGSWGHVIYGDVRA